MDTSKKMQLIDSTGEFRENELREFVTSAQVDSSSDYLVVAIMGPQSSGKSTLVNHVVSENAYCIYSFPLSSFVLFFVQVILSLFPSSLARTS